MDSLQFPQTINSQDMRVEADRISSYAKLTADFNPLHLDEEFAAGTTFGGTIAHGTMSLNLLVSTCDSLKPQFELRTMNIRFTAPCPRGEKLSAEMVLTDPATGTYDVWVTRSDGVRVIEGTAKLGAPQEGAPIDATLIPTDKNTKNASNQ